MDEDFYQVIQVGAQLALQQGRELVGVGDGGVCIDSTFQRDRVALVEAAVPAYDDIVRVIQGRDAVHNLVHSLVHALLEIGRDRVTFQYLPVSHLDMGMHRVDLGFSLADLAFEPVHKVVRLSEGELWIDADMDFHVKIPIHTLHPALVNH